MKLTVVAGSAPDSQNRCAEIHSAGEQCRRRREVVRLLRFRKHERNVVPLIAPGILIHRREEDAVGSVNHEILVRQTFCQTETRREVAFIGVHQAFRVAILPPTKTEGVPSLKIRLVFVLFLS